jgi:hypothetical protein
MRTRLPGSWRRLNFSRSVVSIVSACVVLGIVTAAEKANAYRPFDGTDAEVAGVGEFELEIGPAHFYSQGGVHYLVSPATVLNFGFLPRVELVVDFKNFVALEAIPGQARDRLLDTDVLLKAVLLPGSLQEAGGSPSLAVEAGPLLPNVNGESGFGAMCNFIVSQRWHYVSVHVNSSASLTRSALHPNWFEGVIIEGPFATPLRPVAELFVEHEFLADETTWSALAGAIWRARDGLDFDFGLREATIGDQPVTEVRLGATWALPLWDRK